MTTYRVSWSEGSAVVSTPGEVEAVLDRIAADCAGEGAFLVHLWPDGDDETAMEVVWGDPERAMLMYADQHGGGWAMEPGLPPLTRDLDYDHGSIEPDRTRLSAKAARAAVAEFVATGKRPTCVVWEG